MNNNRILSTLCTTLFNLFSSSRTTKDLFSLFLATALITTIGSTAFAAFNLSTIQREKIDTVTRMTLRSTGATSASIAVILAGNIVYENAYGLAQTTPPRAASTSMRYAIGSVTKQFTTTALLLLVEENKLSLDDKVDRWFPQLTRANDVTIRQLLSMTAGYQDFWPHDYVCSTLLEPTTPKQIVMRYAAQPVDFEPGTRWQYSNTNYMIAGLIIEKISGMPLFEFLQQRLFKPLKMRSVTNIDDGPLEVHDAAGYLRNALGPLRPAPHIAKGWLFAAGQLAMSAHDLALWDLSIINQTILKPASYRLMQTQVLLNNGVATQYGLGLCIGTKNGRRYLAHGGAISGYSSSNTIYPDNDAAIIVFTNVYPGAAGTESQISQQIATLLFQTIDSDELSINQRARSQALQIFTDLRNGIVNRSLFSENCNRYFTDQVIADFSSSLKALQEPAQFKQVKQGVRGGMTFRSFQISCGEQRLKLTVRTLTDGKIEQYQIEGKF